MFYGAINTSLESKTMQMCLDRQSESGTQACTLSIWDVGTEGSNVQSQPRLHSKTPVSKPHKHQSNCKTMESFVVC